MIDLSNQKLSNAIRLIGQEVNRGMWNLDRNDGIPCFAVQEIQVQAEVVVSADDVVIRQVNVTDAGEGTVTDVAESTGTDTGTTTTQQSGGNTDVQTRTFRSVP